MCHFQPATAITFPKKNFDNFSFYHRSPTAVKIKLETAKQFSHLFQSDSLAPSRIC